MPRARPVKTAPNQTIVGESISSDSDSNLFASRKFLMQYTNMVFFYFFFSEAELQQQKLKKVLSDRSAAPSQDLPASLSTTVRFDFACVLNNLADPLHC